MSNAKKRASRRDTGKGFPVSIWSCHGGAIWCSSVKIPEGTALIEHIFTGSSREDVLEQATKAISIS
jgi:hypothetical protein